MFSTIISIQELKKIIDSSGLIIFDCRHSIADTSAGQKAYEVSHIQGAIYLHLDRDLSGEIIPGVTGRHPLPPLNVMAACFNEWGITANKQIVVYDDKKGAIAARLWWMLRYAGHEKVAVLDGGWQAWEQANFPVEATINKPKASTFKFTPQTDWVLNADQIQEIESNSEWAIIDSRSPERYRGEVEPIDPIAGHVLGAISRPFADNWTREGLMKSPEVLQKRFSNLPPAEQCVFYCGSGVTACHNILAFAHAGLRIPRLYPGSWSDWITNETRLEKKKIIAISGSTRKTSSSKSILKALEAMHPGDLKVEIFEGLGQLPHFNPDLDNDQLPIEVAAFRRRIEGADGVVICTPEYVFSLPGSLKNALEWAVSTTIFSNKSVAIIVAAASGKKAFESLDLVMTTIEAKMNDDTKLLIKGAKGKVDKNGNMTDAKTVAELKTLVESLIKIMHQKPQTS